MRLAHRPASQPSLAACALMLALAALTVTGCAHTVGASHRDEPTSAAPTHAPHRGWLGEGFASFYGPGLWGNKTASGERLKKTDFTAAHRTLSFGTCLTVLNLENGRSVRVRVNDRGPFVKSRLIDVSQAAGRALGMLERGLARVRLFACGHEPVDLRDARR